ncbi:MAG: helix-turn-helix domain-containing protein, partial [Dysosmobacter sp.]|nr:helix-turn-helix domain-containing protein [Dysosmobacter sp.]
MDEIIPWDEWVGVIEPYYPMAVFRVEKNKGYTVMSNHHLRNKALSLKAKGLLSQMLSLPEDWDYTLKGLSLINRESIDAIRTAVWELERAGYI